MSMALDSESCLAEEIEAILTQVGLQELQDKFISEKVYVAAVPLITDEQLRQLGVARMGDRAALVQACKRTCSGFRISQEVKRIMQPSLPAAVTARSSDTGSSSATTRNPSSPPSGLVGGYRIPAVENRRLRRRQSSKLMSLGTSSVSDSVAPRQASFSKKLFVFRYMHGAPKSFIRKNKDIVARGFVNDICVNATEQEVRDEICAVLVNSELPQLVTPNAFEFIDVSGKLAFVPSIKEGFEFNGRIVKQFAGTVSLYIRLLQNLDASIVADPEEFAIIPDSDDDKGLPPLPFKLCHESNSNAAMSTHRGDDLIGDSVLAQSNDDHDLVSMPLEESTPIGASQSGVSMPLEEFTPIGASQSGDRPSSNANQCGDSNGEQPGPSRVLNKVQQLQQAFSNLPTEFISTVYGIAKCDFVAFSEGLKLFRIRSLMTSHPKMFEKKFVGCSSVIAKKEVKDLIRTIVPHGSNPVQLELLNASGIFIDNSSVEDLRKFLLFSMGCQEPLCNRIIIEFTNDELAPALVANTCSRVLTISLRISPTGRLIDGLKAVINGNDSDFTMV